MPFGWNYPGVAAAESGYRALSDNITAANDSSSGYDYSGSSGYSGYSGYSGSAGSWSDESSGFGDDTSSTDFATPGVTLKGNSLEFVNKVVVIIFAFVLGCSLVGLFVDRVILRRKLAGSPKDRPRGWVIGMLCSSYVLLAPGLFCNLFAFKIADMGGMQTLKEREDNMLEFAHELWQYESYFGVFCIIGFAMVIPVVKLVLLTLGGILRHDGDPERVENARRAIHFVQIISKWASPDMFAYILLLYLIRALNHPPMLIGLFELDVGFTCFSVFCIFSTISSLGVRSPPKYQKDMMTKRPGTLKALLVVLFTSLAFWVLLAFGLKHPCMAMRLDFENMVASGQIDASMLPIIESLHIADLASADVTVWGCLNDLWNWSFPEGKGMELNCFIAWTMFGVFVVAFTVIDMVVVLITAFVMHFTKTRPTVLLEITHIFRKLSMLDVAVVGVIVIVAAGQIYAKMGVMLSISLGLWELAVAELCHYAAHYTIIYTGRKMASESQMDFTESDSAATSDEDVETSAAEE